MKLDKLKKYLLVDKIIYHSIDLALYQVSAVIDGEEHSIFDGQGQRLSGRNLLMLQKQLEGVSCINHVLRHESAYDEMIGGPDKVSNLLEVPIGDNKLY